jgi:hypothetical protein
LAALVTHRGPVPLGGGPEGAAADVLGAAAGAELDGELAGWPDDRVGCGCGLGEDFRPECPVQWTGTECAGHFGAAVVETRVSFPDARQA